MKALFSITGLILAILVAAITDSSGQTGLIYGCYSNRNGALRIVTGPNQCTKSETAISWNQMGPAGPPGPAPDLTVYYTKEEVDGMLAEIKATIPAPLRFVQASTVYHHTCALKSNGTLTCWGLNNYDQNTPPPTGAFRQVSAGAYHTCGVKSDGIVVCWGYNTYGESNPPLP